MNNHSDIDQIQRYIHKHISCRLWQEGMTFALSQELFSSFSIDTGTKHLIDSLSRCIDPGRVQNVLDIGCGTGVLAVTIAKRIPHAAVYAVDRDVLACTFTAYNARENQVSVISAPGLDSLPHEKDFPDSYDLIVSNLPAKAGRPVLQRIITNSLALLNQDGKFAAVIVAPLYQTFAAVCEELSCEIIEVQRNQRHVTIIAQPGKYREKLEHAFPGSYFRLASSHPVGRGNRSVYHIDAVFNLPGFDTAPYQVQSLSAALPDTLQPGRFLFWNPGQGHLPLQVLSRFSHSLQFMEIIIAGRDVLAVKAAAHNVSRNYPNLPVTLLPAADISSAMQSLQNEITGCFLDFGDSTAAVDSEDIRAVSTAPITAAGIVGITGKSSAIASLPKKIPGFAKSRSKKSRGYRSLVYKHTEQLFQKY